MCILPDYKTNFQSYLVVNPENYNNDMPGILSYNNGLPCILSYNNGMPGILTKNNDNPCNIHLLVK